MTSPFIHLVLPFTSRPWRKKDLEKNPDTVPHLNEQGYVDFYSGDPEDPRNWSRARSWVISLGAIFLVFDGTVASGLGSGITSSLATYFSVSETAAGLNTTLFLLGYCAGPFLFAPISEMYGRKWLIWITFTSYLAFNVLCAFAPNFGALLVGRFLAGTFVSAPLCAAPGIMADLWHPIERDTAMAFFSVAIWAGPSIGPIVASFLDDAQNWRWAFYFMLMLGSVSFLILCTLPETHAITILKEKAMRHREAKIPGYTDSKTEAEVNSMSLIETYKAALLRPWILLFDPISFLCAIYMGTVFTLQFMLFSIYPIVFHDIRGWSAPVAQLPLLGIVVGAFLGAGCIVLDTRRRQRIFETKRYLVPEDQLLPAMFGGVGFAVTMFWLAWTGPYKSIHWFVPTLAGTLLSWSLFLVFVAFVNYLIESYGHYAASIMAVNTVARSLGGASAPLFTNFMFEAMGVGGGGSLIAGLATVLAIIPFVFSKYGRSIRIASKYTEAAVSKDVDPSRAAGEEHPTSYEENE